MRRLLVVTTIVVSFCLFFTVIMMAESDYEYSRNRLLLINNIENLELVKNNDINISGDYLIGFNGIENMFNMVYLNKSITMFDEDNLEYASYNYYLEGDYDNFLKILGDLFDEPIVDYIDLRDPQNVKTNISESQEAKYQNTLKIIKDINETIQGERNYYDVDYNEEWLRVFDSFGIDTGKIINQKVIDKNITKIKENELYKQKFLSTFFKIFVPYIECTTNYCTYNENNIDKIEEMVNANLKMKINYQFLNVEEYKKIDEEFNEEELNTIKEENKKQEDNSNTQNEISQEVDSDGDGIFDSSDPYPQDPYNNQSVDEKTDNNTSSNNNSSSNTGNDNSTDTVDDGNSESEVIVDGGDETDTGGDVTDPDTGGDVTDPDTGGDVTDPDTGGDVTDPDTGGDVTDPDTDGDGDVTDGDDTGIIPVGVSDEE